MCLLRRAPISCVLKLADARCPRTPIFRIGRGKSEQDILRRENTIAPLSGRRPEGVEKTFRSSK
jgi:hypothetical protein